MPTSNEPRSNVPRVSITGLTRASSAVALGFMEIVDFDECAAVLDAFWAAGGNLFDTAWIYNGGHAERLLGRWLAARSTRRDALVIGKGAHTPQCVPDAIGAQLDESLDRMGTDYVDVYLMHRDNLDVPVGEFVEAIDAEVTAGRIRGPYGGSNWTMERVDEAQAYASMHDRRPPQVLSNNVSLAEMLDPIWPGCVSSSGPAWRDWLRDRALTNLAWSSQSRGFFTDRAGRDRLDDEELVRVWYSDANFARRERAIALGNEIGRSPIHIALAYVRAQPYPSVPIIGPRSIDELHDSLSACAIELTNEQVAFLEGAA